MKTAIYIRRSRDEQSEYSIEAQERQCRLYCELEGLEVADTYIDDDWSGTRSDRPSFERMMADFRLGRIKALVVHKLDRLARNAELCLKTVNELEKLGVIFHSVSERIDFSSPMGRMVLTTLSGVAEYYSRNLSTETKKGLREKAEQGYWIGPVPLGYMRSEATLIPSPDASTIQLIYSLYQSGLHSYTSVADYLNERGYTTLDWRTGERGRFGRESVRTILKNRAYLGIVTCDGQEYSGKHPALIGEAVWNACQSHREKRSSKGGAYSISLPRRGGLLTEIAACHLCGDKMWYQHTGRKSSPGLYYICSGRSRRTCNAPLSRAEPNEAQVLAVLRNLELPSSWHEEVLERAQRTIDIPKQRTITPEAIQGQIERLSIAWTRGDLSDEVYQRERSRLRALLADAPILPPTQELDLQRGADLLRNMKDLVDGATPEEQRSLIRAIFSRVWVEKREVKAIAPTSEFYPLIKAMLECWSGGWLTGLEPATS